MKLIHNPLLDLDWEDNNVLGHMRDMMTRLGQPEALARAIGAHFAEQMRNLMASGTLPDGSPYEPLKKPGRSNRVGGRLMKTGKLHDTIHYVVSGSGDQVAIGHSMYYGVYQNGGIPSHNVPATPFVGVPDGSAEFLAKEISRFAHDIMVRDQHIGDSYFGAF